MPEPVFRSSKGRTLKKGYEGDEHETEIANAIPDTQEFDAASIDSPLGPVDAPQSEPKVRAVAPPQKKGGCAKSFVFLVGAIGLGAAAIIAALVWFFYYSNRAGGDPFQ